MAIRKKPGLDEVKKKFIDSASAELYPSEEDIDQYQEPYSLDKINIDWQDGSKCAKNLTISLSEMEWNTLHHHIMKYGGRNKAKWIRYYLFKGVEQEMLEYVK